MTNHINDFWLDEYCTEIARDISRDARDYEQAMDWATESADGSEYVIYTHKAHMVCQNCNVDNGKDFLRDCYGEYGNALDYDEAASAIAYGELLTRIQSKINKHFEEWKEGAAA